MATQKDFRIKNGLIVQNGNTTVSQGTVSISDQISGDTGQLTITNGQSGSSFMRIGMIGSGTANSHIRTDSTLEFHIGQSATTATPSVSIDTSGNIQVSGNVNASLVSANNISGDVLQINNTTVVNSSRNLVNIGTISSGAITGTTATFNYTGDAIAIKSIADGTTPVGITFTSQGASGTQIGHVRYTHRDALSYDSNESFTIGGTESTTTILADGKLMFKEGLYVKPSSGTGAGTQIIDSSRNLSNIGTISSGNIDVTSTTAGQGASIEVHATTNEWGNALLIAKSDNANTFIHAGVKIHGSGNPFYIYQSNGSATNTLRFNYNGFSDTGGQMTIASNGDISFYEDTGTTAKLFWDSSAESLGIGLTNPSEKLEVSGKIKASGQIRAGSYLESFPSFSFANDTDTGMFSDTANQLEFSTGGSSRLVIDSSGNATFAGTISSGAITSSGLSYLTQVDSSEFRNTTRVSNATTPANTAGWFKIAKVVRGGGRILLSFTGGSYTPDTFVIDYYRNWSTSGSLFLKKYQGTGFITKARIRQDSADSIYYVEIYCASHSNGLSFQVYHQRLQGYASSSNQVYGGSLSAGATSGTDVVTEQSFISRGIWNEGIEADYYYGHVNIHSGSLKLNNTTVIDSSRNLTNIGTISSGEITTTAPQFKYVSNTDSNVGLLIRDETYISNEADITASRLAAGNNLTLGLAGQVGINAYIGGVNKFSINSSGNATFAGTISSGAITSSGFITVNNSAGDKKISFNRTGGKNISIEHDTNQIYFWNNTDSNFLIKMSNTGLVQSKIGFGVDGTIFIDSSRNLTNIASISVDGSAKSVFANTSSSTIDLSSGTSGALQIGTNSSTVFASIAGRQTNTSQSGLGFYSATTDGNTSAFGDMHFNVRENNNSTFATLTKKAFVWTHYLSELAHITRAGNLSVTGTIRSNSNSTSIFGGAITAQGNIQTDSGVYKIGNDTVIDDARNLTNIGTISSSGNHNITSGSNQILLAATNGAIELTRSGGGPFIDFKNSTSEDFDARILNSGNGLTFITGGNGSTATGLTINSSQNATFNGAVEVLGNIDGTTADFGGAVSVDGLLTANDGALIKDSKSSSNAEILTIKNTSTTNEGRYLQFNDNSGTDVGQIGHVDQTESNLFIATFGTGLKFESYITYKAILPCDGDGADSDNAIDLGSSSVRFDDIYATNGTIQTSDRNQKQDIQALTDAEQRVATACKGLIRRFRWQDSVAEKDDNSDSDETARYHFGVIAQDLQDAFTAEGLDASDYGMFISSTWTDDDGVEQTRLGVRYNELLAFIITTI